jgi:hypothetical protein
MIFRNSPYPLVATQRTENFDVFLVFQDLSLPTIKLPLEKLSFCSRAKEDEAWEGLNFIFQVTCILN